MYGTGPRIQRLVPGVTVLDGCIYIVGFVSAPGEKSLRWEPFSAQYTEHIKGTDVSPELLLEAVRDELVESGRIKVDLSLDIQRIHSSNGHSSRQWPSPVPTTTSQWVKYRNRANTRLPSSAFHGERCIGQKLGIEFPEDPVGYNLTSNRINSTLKALLHAERRQKVMNPKGTGLLFDMITAAEEQGIDVPTYREVAKNSDHKIKPYKL